MAIIRFRRVFKFIMINRSFLLPENIGSIAIGITEDNLTPANIEPEAKTT